MTLNGSAYVGMCIPDFSRSLMYNFHHNIKQKDGNKAKLLFTDSDSGPLTYEIEADVYMDLVIILKTALFFLNIGKMKDEACGILITECVGLRSNMSSCMKDNDKGGKSAKWLRKISKEIKLKNYKEVLLNNKQMLPKLKT